MKKSIWDIVNVHNVGTLQDALAERNKAWERLMELGVDREEAFDIVAAVYHLGSARSDRVWAEICKEQ
jgi:hypothetical protein